MAGIEVATGKLVKSKHDGMVHLDEEWIIENNEVITEESAWCICKISPHLPSDATGIETLQYICDLHNAELERKREAP